MVFSFHSRFLLNFAHLDWRSILSLCDGITQNEWRKEERARKTKENNRIARANLFSRPNGCGATCSAQIVPEIDFQRSFRSLTIPGHALLGERVTTRSKSALASRCLSSFFSRHPRSFSSPFLTGYQLCFSSSLRRLLLKRRTE